MLSIGRARYLAGRGMAGYLAGRLMTGIGTLLIVTIVVFASMHLIPGSYADVVMPYEVTSPEMRESLEAKYGLDRPLPVQYLTWLRNVASGDFGESLGGEAPVSDLLVRRLPVTVELALLSLLLTVVIGLPLALLAGMARRLSREVSRLAGAVAMSTPEFVTGSLFVYLFSRYALGLRVGDYVPFAENPLENLRVMLLPALTISIFGVAMVVRFGRDAVAGVLSEPHVTAALARGESKRHIVRHHVLRNATIPVLTVLAIFAGFLMGGAVIVENLFSLPGLGRAALLAINQRDYPVLQSVVLIAAAAFIAINMLADFAYGVIDPRVRAEKA